MITLNMSITLYAMLISKKLSGKDFIWYVVFQFLGGLAGSAILYAILVNTDIGTAAMGANGYGSLSATNISLLGALITEVVLTCVFVYTILGVTSDDKKSSVAGIVIGLTLTFVHLLGIGLTGTSVNPARSFAPALFVGGKALSQVWVFLVAPLVGAAIAAYLFKYLNVNKKKKSK